MGVPFYKLSYNTRYIDPIVLVQAPTLGGPDEQEIACISVPFETCKG